LHENPPSVSSPSPIFGDLFLTSPVGPPTLSPGLFFGHSFFPLPFIMRVSSCLGFLFSKVLYDVAVSTLLPLSSSSCLSQSDLPTPSFFFHYRLRASPVFSNPRRFFFSRSPVPFVRRRLHRQSRIECFGCCFFFFYPRSTFPPIFSFRPAFFGAVPFFFSSNHPLSILSPVRLSLRDVSARPVQFLCVLLTDWTLTQAR